MTKTETEIKIGDVIRSKTGCTGTLIGPHMMVEEITEFGLYARELGTDSASNYYVKRLVEKLQQITLEVPVNDFIKITQCCLDDESGVDIHEYRHAINKSWSNAANITNYDVAIIKAKKFGQMVVKNPSFSRVLKNTYIKGIKRVHLYVKMTYEGILDLSTTSEVSWNTYLKNIK